MAPTLTHMSAPTDDYVARPGLPMPTARIANQRGETLVDAEALLDAREATPHITETSLNALRHMLAPPTASETINLIAEIDRLRELEADRVVLLERLAYVEAQQYDHELKYGLCLLAVNTYLPWSFGGDGPVGYGLMTRNEAIARGWTEAVVDRARADAATTKVLLNRAGPGEACLTRDALIEAYSSRQAYTDFRLTPNKVQPYTTSGGDSPATGQWDDTYIHWVPWAPDETPATLPEGWHDRF